MQKMLLYRVLIHGFLLTQNCGKCVPLITYWNTIVSPVRQVCGLPLEGFCDPRLPGIHARRSFLSLVSVGPDVLLLMHRELQM